MGLSLEEGLGVGNLGLKFWARDFLAVIFWAGQVLKGGGSRGIEVHYGW